MHRFPRPLLAALGLYVLVRAWVLPTAGAANAQYDVFDRHVTRFVHTLGHPSPPLKNPPSQQQILEAMRGGPKPPLAPGAPARSVLAEDMLFATLDPTLRRMKLPHGRTVILSDTVGFISNLPTHLVAAFRATLEEVLEADLILHVRDMSDPDNAAQSGDVLRILTDLGIDEKEREKRIIEVWNKIDRLDPDAHDALIERAHGRDDIMAVSAVSGEGVEPLMEEISRRLSGVLTEASITIPADKLALVSWVYENAIVDGREDLEDGAVELDVRLSAGQAVELERKLGIGQAPQKEDWER